MIKRVIGILLLASGFFTILSANSGFTGFAIIDNYYQINQSYLIGLIAVISGIFLIITSRRFRLTSRIHYDKGLERLAYESTKDQSVQRDIDHLSYELSKGNINAGTGSKKLDFGNISYLRGKNAGRLFYRPSSDGSGYEILGKSSKYTEQQVIDKLEILYKEKLKRKVG